MNDIIKDYLKENFTLKEWIKYGVCYPIGLILACVLADWLNSLY